MSVAFLLNIVLCVTWPVFYHKSKLESIGSTASSSAMMKSKHGIAADMTTSVLFVRILRLSKDGLTWFIILLQKYDFFDLFRELRSSLVDYVSLGRLMGIDRDTTNYVS